MSERDIRGIIKAICQEIDHRDIVRKTVMAGRKVVIPAVIGASMTLSAAGCAYGAPDYPDGGDDPYLSDSGPSDEDAAFDSGAIVEYAAPPDIDSGAVAEYAAPDFDGDEVPEPEA